MKENWSGVHEERRREKGRKVLAQCLEMINAVPGTEAAQSGIYCDTCDYQFSKEFAAFECGTCGDLIERRSSSE